MILDCLGEEGGRKVRVMEETSWKEMVRHAQGWEREAGGPHTAGLGDGGRAKEDKRLQELQRQGTDLPWSLQEEHGPPTPGSGSHETQVGLLTSRIMRC